MSANLLRQVLYARGFFLSSIYRAILQSVGFLPAELHIILAKVLSPFGSRDLFAGFWLHINSCVTLDSYLHLCLVFRLCDAPLFILTNVLTRTHDVPYTSMPLVIPPGISCG